MRTNINILILFDQAISTSFTATSETSSLAIGALLGNSEHVMFRALTNLPRCRCLHSTGCSWCLYLDHANHSSTQRNIPRKFFKLISAFYRNFQLRSCRKNIDIIFSIWAIYWLFLCIWKEKIELGDSIGFLGLYAFYILTGIVNSQLIVRLAARMFPLQSYCYECLGSQAQQPAKGNMDCRRLAENRKSLN